MIAEDKELRAQALVERVAALQLDVLGLQEVYCEAALRSLVCAGGLPRAGLPHMAHFVSGCSLPATSHGSGLLLASRYPIAETLFHGFSAGGDITSLEFDAQAGKGIGLARLELPGGRACDVYVSHLQAQYADAPRDSYAAQRALQAFEAAQFICATRRAPLTVLLADLNAGPAALPYRVVAELCELCDAYSAHSPRGAERAITDSTFGRAENVYSHAYRASAAASSGYGCARLAPPPPQCDRDARLDYVLVGDSGGGGGGGGERWSIVDSGIAFTQPLTPPQPGARAVSLSDHAAVYAELAAAPAGAAAASAAGAQSPLGGGSLVAAAAAASIAEASPLSRRSPPPLERRRRGSASGSSILAAASAAAAAAASPLLSADAFPPSPDAAATAFVSLPGNVFAEQGARALAWLRCGGCARPVAAAAAAAPSPPASRRSHLLAELRSTLEAGARRQEAVRAQRMLTSSALMLGGLGCAVAALRCTAAASAAATATAGVVLAGSLAIAATWAYSILLVAPTITAALLRLGGVLAAGVAACALTMREGGPLSVLVGLGLAAACGGPVVFFIAVVLVAREANAFHAAIARVHTLQLRSARGSPPASA